MGTDVETGTERFTLGIPNLLDDIELVGLALGLFGIAEVHEEREPIFRGEHTLFERRTTRSASIA
ncbi:MULTISPECIES: tripartite tricarboxylate transporter permease [Bradyrhizobium]|uniref:tripartite tricarboxylate transporter permease n=1 Tax=Bradyrhizobium TaxID=374 RepID=UPI001FD93B41|nr:MULTISPECIES: tripartite tricarboxylate transporter permease [Bradyrhizobium]